MGNQVNVQVRMYPGGLHIQGKGPNINRSYGIAVTPSCPPRVRKFVDGLKRTLPSLAATGQVYAPATLELKDNEVLVMLLEGKVLHIKEGTESYGELVRFIEAVENKGEWDIDFCS